jgi:ubiquinone/menaquinone biosynthesis C-methylase UbiE
MAIPRLSALVQRAEWAAWYRLLSWYAARRGASFSTMNWGYDDGRELVREGAERYCLQLYHALVEGVPLAGRTLVDVSAGRGGGLAYLARTFAPAEAIGIDFVPRHVELCRRAHAAASPALRFLVGDAERLPLADASADVVLSVEASHCYGDLGRFTAEARRVLRPGGHLLWTDFVPREDEAKIDLAARGFTVVEARDITPHVLAAMAADAGRRRALIEGSAPRFTWPLLLHFAAADPRCETVERFASGRYRYFLRRLRRA